MTKENSNGGFTLVELLVAVVILAIVTTPLLHSFVTSARTTARAAQIGAATLAAQNIQETLEATHGDELAALADDNAASLLGAQSAAVTLGDDGGITLKLDGISAGGRTFDAAVVMDPTVHMANAVDISQYTPMDVVFSQPTGDYDPDAMAFAEFQAAAALILSSVTPPETVEYDRDPPSTAVISSGTTRQIDVYYNKGTVTEDSFTLTISAQYSYSYTFGYTDYDELGEGAQSFETLTETFTYPMYSETFEVNSDLPSLYFFYERHANHERGNLADVTIHNKGDLTPKIFIVEQEVAPGDIYSSKVDLLETSIPPGTGNKSHADVYCNIGANSESYSYWIFKGDTWYYDGDFRGGKLVATKQENRLYEVTINIYEQGTAEDPLFTLNASKLD